MTQTARAAAFKALHETGEMFVIPNPWDAGSARLLAGLGFKALATTSAGFARTLGRNDYQVTRDEKLAHIRDLVAATELPLSADLENGFGDAPEDCAETVQLGAEAGLVGGSIEDATGDADSPQYDIATAAERVCAAAEAANAMPYPFMLTARAENYLTGNPDLADTIKRLQAYQEAGAHVLYAPALRTLDDIKTVLSEIDRPLNVLFGPFDGFVPLSVLDFYGVARVSVGSGLANAVYGHLTTAARELRDTGSLDFMSKAPSGAALSALSGDT